MKKLHWGLIIGCCVLLLILAGVGGIAAYGYFASQAKNVEKAIKDSTTTDFNFDDLTSDKSSDSSTTDNTKKDNTDKNTNTKKELDLDDPDTQDQLIQYHNDTYTYRLAVYNALLDLNDTLTEDVSSSDISIKIIEAKPVIDSYEQKINKEKSISPELNQLEQDFLKAAKKIVSNADNLVTYYDDIPKYNEYIADHDAAFDELEAAYDAINAYMDQFSEVIE